MRARRAQRLRLWIWLLIALCARVPEVAAQYKVEKHRELGVTISRPRKFDPIPTQPSERWVKLYYREEIPESIEHGGTRRRAQPALRLIEIPRVAAVTPGEASLEPTPPEGEGGEGKGGQGGKREGGQGQGDAGGQPDGSDADQPPRKPPVLSFSSYLASEWPEWSFISLGEGKRQRDHKTWQYKLKGPTLTGRVELDWSGYAYTFEGAERTLVLMGTCDLLDYEELQKLWSKVGDKLKIEQPTRTLTSAGESKWERYYRTKRLSHPEYRARVREAVVGSWEVDDTPNFIFVFNTKDEPLLRKLMRDIELLREEYMKRFPPVDPDFDAVSTVRICKDKAEYLAYGGSARSAGYWNHKTEELVLYDAEVREKGERPDDSNTFIVLYHEAFHQYIHYSTGELPPHSWFNEGYGDYFAGARIKNGRVREIGPNPWRLGLMQAIANGDTRFSSGRKFAHAWVPWETMIHYSQAEYYEYGYANYAQGWSMVYFLAEAKEVERRPEWKRILPTYFQALKAAYEQELSALADPDDETQREAAGERARESAVETAFAGLDLDELERAWLEFVRALEAD